jgi:hypothetical protein
VRQLFLLIAALLVSACARPDYGESRPDWLLVSAGPQPGYAIKLVVEKDPPLTLVADDGSLCRTSKERYKATKEGAWIACLWNLPTPDRMGLATAD